MLQGIVKADDRYIGGKPRKGSKRDDDKPGKRMRGTNKMPVAGAVERGGSVVEKVAENLERKGLVRFIKGSVQEDGTLVVTDKPPASRPVSSEMSHATNMRCVKRVGIKGFWGLLERVLLGSPSQVFAQACRGIRS